jgi:KAP family P-loop domain
MEQYQRSGYDSPQGSESGDDLERWRFAGEIVEVIRTTPPDWSTRIGIFGKWGEGKSTVLRFISKMLAESKDVVFTFNPWAIRDWDSLWTEFGDQFADSLEEAEVPFYTYRKSRLERILKKYSPQAEVVSGIASAMVGHGLDKAHTFAFRALKDLLAHDAPELIEIRQKLGDRRVVALIDDLDRAQPTLIPQLLLALRELLDLPGFAFVLAFDDEIVEYALAETNKAWGDGSDFLEKILDFRFHLPPVTPEQKRRLVERSVSLYCPFIEASSALEVEDLLPGNPRKLKRLIRSMRALKSQIARHDPDEFHWVDVWLTQMIRQESEDAYRAISDEDTWNRLGGVLYQLRDQHPKLRSDSASTKDEPELEELFVKCKVSSGAVKERLTALVKAARARASNQFIYAVTLVGRPCAVTWKEFRGIYGRWECDQRPLTLKQLLGEHASSHGLPLQDVEREVFNAICDDRQNCLSAAADAQSIEEHDVLIKKAGKLITMADQFLDGGMRLTGPRFSRLWEQYRAWISFKRNPSDAKLRQLELTILENAAKAATSTTAIEIYEALNITGSGLDIIGTSEEAQKAAKDLASIVVPHVIDSAMQSLKDEGGVRRLSEPGRFPSVVEALFSPSSALWTQRRDDVLAVMLSGREDSRVYENVREFLLLLQGAFALVARNISIAWAKALANDSQIIQTVWEIAISRPIQYRMQVAYLRVRQMLISHGSDQQTVPLNEELSRRNAELEEAGGGEVSQP